MIWSWTDKMFGTMGWLSGEDSRNEELSHFFHTTLCYSALLPIGSQGDGGALMLTYRQPFSVSENP